MPRLSTKKKPASKAKTTKKNRNTAKKKVAGTKVTPKKTLNKKKLAAKKTAAKKKPIVKKLAVKKSTAKKKPAVKKVVAKKKSPAKKKPAVKKVVAKKKSPAKKKPAVKKVVAKKKSPAKKKLAVKKVVAKKKAPVKQVIVKQEPKVKPIVKKTIIEKKMSETKDKMNNKADRLKIIKQTSQQNTKNLDQKTDLKSINKRKIIEAYKKSKESQGNVNKNKIMKEVEEVVEKKKPNIISAPAFKKLSDLPEVPKDYNPSENEDYMNNMMLAYFRDQLYEWKEELINQSRNTMSSLKEESKIAPDPNDQATDEMNRALELRARDRYRKLIHKIDKALDRILQGEYGYCEESGDPIGIKRLLARPIATLTIEAQERHENYERSHTDED